MLQLDRTRRACRAGEWTKAKAVTFIVALAARRLFTLAAARGTMRREPACSVEGRDPAFAAAWNEALSSVVKRRPNPASCSGGGNKVGEVYGSPVKRRQGDNPSPPRAGLFDRAMRDIFFAKLANRSSNEPPARLAREGTLP